MNQQGSHSALILIYVFKLAHAQSTSAALHAIARHLTLWPWILLRFLCSATSVETRWSMTLSWLMHLSSPYAWESPVDILSKTKHAQVDSLLAAPLLFHPSLKTLTSDLTLFVLSTYASKPSLFCVVERTLRTSKNLKTAD